MATYSPTGEQPLPQTSPDIVARARLHVRKSAIDDFQSVLERVASIDADRLPLAWLTTKMPFQLVDIPISPRGRYTIATTASDAVFLSDPLRIGDVYETLLLRDPLDERRPGSNGTRLALLTYRYQIGSAAEVKWVGALLGKGLPAHANAGSPPDKATAPTAPTAPLSLDLFRQWSDLTGDADPVHLDHQSAAAAGLPGPVAHASLITAIAESLLAPLVAGSLVELEVRHRAGAHAGDQLHLSLGIDGRATLWCRRGKLADCRYR
jgi:hypothetical protein